MGTTAIFVGLLSFYLILIESKPPNQLDFPGCPIAHQPQYYCCDHLDGHRFVYTLYKRPSTTTNPLLSSSTENIIYAGWYNDKRQVLPGTKEFYYNEIGKTCHILRALDSPEEKLLCDEDLMNSDLGQQSLDPNLFMTYPGNPVNNNASCPLGAKFTALMPRELSNYHSDEKVVKVPRVSYLEWGFLLVYSVYGITFIFLVVWAIIRSRLEKLGHGCGDLESGKMKAKETLLENPFGSSPSSVVSMATSKAPRPYQQGYVDTFFGRFLMYLVVLLLLSQFCMVIAFPLNSVYGILGPQWVKHSEQKSVVYLFLLFGMTFSYGIVVALRDRFINFFRAPSSLEDANWIHLIDDQCDSQNGLTIPSSSRVIRLIHHLEDYLLPSSKYHELVPVHRDAYDRSLRYVQFQHTRYVYDASVGAFVHHNISTHSSYSDILADAQGMSKMEHQRTLAIVGPNKMEITMQTLGESLVEEFFSVFYLYQAVIYLTGFYYKFWYMTIVYTVIIAGTGAIRIYSKRKMRWAVVSRLTQTPTSRVYLENEWHEVDSAKLVPGDLVEIQRGAIVPADMVIVSGILMVDESMMTGESKPLQKFPLPCESDRPYDIIGESRRHTLFCGTKVLRSGIDPTDKVYAVVYRTGASTMKGQLLKTILAPKKIGFKYYDHLKVIIVIFVLMAICICGAAMYLISTNKGISSYINMWGFVVFMTATCISPMIPVALTLGQLCASQRLHANGIYTLNPERIIFAGKVRLFCFDKTGTLTKQGLDFLGCSEWHGGNVMSPVLARNVNKLNPMLDYGLASCHSLGTLNGEIIGNEVEKKMFSGSEYTMVTENIVESADGKVKLELLKRYEFDQNRMTMSVIARDVYQNEVYAFCKGSPEKLNSICVRLPGNCSEVDEEFSSRGCYTLSMGFRKLGKYCEHDRQKWNQMERSVIECELIFSGFICFRNELKDDSKQVINALREGNTRSVMITGDNARTAIYIARECEMLVPETITLLGENFDPSTNAIVWSNITTLRNSSSLQQSSRNFDEKIYYTTEEALKAIQQGENVELAVTSEAFKQLIRTGEIQNLLKHIRVFARMSPADKRECVELFMQQNIITGMCGDGGNDCGALRQAHVGIALSESEASVVSPFSSKSDSIKSVIELCCEGRGSIVTSFACLKFYLSCAIAGQVKNLVVIYHGTLRPQWQVISTDIMTLVLNYCLTLSRPISVLGPHRPTSSLLGPTTLLSVIGQCAIQVGSLFFWLNFLQSQAWYCPFTTAGLDPVHWWLFSDNAITTCTFFYFTLMLGVLAFVYSFGGRYRVPVWRNYGLMVPFLISSGLIFYLLLAKPGLLMDLLRISSSTNVVGLPEIALPFDFRVEFAAILAVHTLLCMFWEYLVSDSPVQEFLRRRYHKDTFNLKL